MARGVTSLGARATTQQLGRGFDSGDLEKIAEYDFNDLYGAQGRGTTSVVFQLLIRSGDRQSFPYHSYVFRVLRTPPRRAHRAAPSNDVPLMVRAV